MSEEEVYEVEEIQAHKFTKKNKRQDVLYFIKWLNYPVEDNTWEKESNIFAVNLVQKYWNDRPSTDKERRQFENINNKRKKPLKLKSDTAEKKAPAKNTSPVVSTDTEASSTPNATASSSTAESSVTAAATAAKNAKHQQTLDSVFGIYKGNGKEKEEVQPPRLPQVIASTNNEDDDMDDDDEPERMEIDSSDDEAYATPTRSSDKSNSPPEEEEEANTAPPTPVNYKRSASNDKQQDYFLEQHEKKRKREELGYSDDSSVEVTPAPDLNKAVVDIEEVQEDDEVIFDEKYAIDPPLDWETQTERVEYIGKEIDQSDLYCLVRWKDGVKSMHSLDLVKQKRPDLVIDRFVQMVLNQ